MPAKILIVDDDPNVQRLLTYTVRQEGYDVITANDGAEAFRMWTAEHPDLVRQMLDLAEQCRADLGDTMLNRKGAGVRAPGGVKE